MKIKRGILMGLKLAVSIALVGVLLNAVGAQDALERFRTVDLGWLALGFAVSLVQVVICAARWRVVLHSIDVIMGFKDAFVYWYIGAFFNQTLPSAVGGDFVRGYLAYKGGAGFAPVVNSLILERVVTVLALLALVAGLSPLAVGMMDNGGWFFTVAWAALAAGVLGCVVLIFLDRLGAKLTERLARFRVVKGMALLAGDARAVLLHPAHAVPALAWSLAGHVNLALVVYLLGRALGLDIELMAVMVLFPPVVLAQTVPISLAGWGVREGAMMAMFALVGVAGDKALALSILFGVVMAVASFPGVVMWLASGRRSMDEAQSFAERAETS